MLELLPLENLQRVGALVALPGLVLRLGANPAHVLTAAGLHADALANAESTIPYAAVGRLLEVAAHTTRCPHLGLLLAEHIGLAALGLTGKLMQNGPTLGAALQDFVAHQHRHAHGSVVYLMVNQVPAVFRYAVYQPKFEGSSHICDLVAMLGSNIVRELARPAPVQDMEVLLSRGEPGNVEAYRRFLGGKLRFNAIRPKCYCPASGFSGL